jgi:hypothetical protein
MKNEVDSSWLFEVIVERDGEGWVIYNSFYFSSIFWI